MKALEARPSVTKKILQSTRRFYDVPYISESQKHEELKQEGEFWIHSSETFLSP
jgi:hypothetical protein